jgi:periplasmic protein TonB
MYADQRFHASRSRTVGLGAAFAVNGAIIAGILFFLAPRFVVVDGPTVLTGRSIPLDDTPPPPVEQPKPKAEPRESRAPQPTAPDPRIRSETPNTTSTTDVIPPDPVPPQPFEKVGPTVIEPVAPPPPLPPLVAARSDPRFARDFQPDYPPSELRAERAGVVSVRILIGADGRVKQVQQVSATSPAFFEATRRQALSKWRFTPATRGGVPEESWKVMSVTFRIENR